MKKKIARVLHSIEIIMVFLAVVIFILASPKTLDYLAKEATFTYELKYKSLTGNILTNIHIKDISYHNNIIAKDANIDFNLLKLLLLQLDIKKIEFFQVDINNLKTFINSIKNEASSKNKKGSILPIIVNIHNIKLNILPYKKDEVEIQKLSIKIKDFYIGSNIDINDLLVDMKSNYFDLSYSGSYKDYFLDIKKFNLTKLDVAKIVKLKDIIKSDRDSNSTIIKFISIKEANISTKPFKKGKYFIESLLVDIKDLDSKDLKRFNAKDIKLDIRTNIWKLKSKGYLKNSTYFSKVAVDLDDKYFKNFIPFFNYNSLNPLDIKLKIDKDKLIGNLKANSKTLLTKKLDKDLKVTIKLLKTYAEFDFKELKLHFNTDSKLTSKYAKDIDLNIDFYYTPKTHIYYSGYVKLKKFKNLDKRVKKLLKGSILTFKGNKKGIKAFLKSNYLTGEYLSSKSYIEPKISIKSKEFFLNELDENISKDIKLSFKTETKLNYKDIQNTFINYDIASNLVNISGRYIVKDNKNSFLVTSSKKSIIKEIDKNINIENILPLSCYLDVKNKSYILDAKNSNMDIKAIYDTKNKEFNTTATLENTTIHIYKQKNIPIKYDIKTPSLKELLKKLNDYYMMPTIPIDADVVLDGSYDKGEFDFHIDLKWLLYEYERYKYFFMEKGSLDAKFSYKTLAISNFNTNAYILDRYRKLFSTKVSTIDFTEDGIKLDIVLNNSIKIAGRLSDTTSITIKSNDYHLVEPEANIFLNLNLRFLSNGFKNSLKGEIYLLKGLLKYKPLKSYEVNDEDIIFTGRVKKKKQSSKNFDISINIVTKNNIKYILDKNKIVFSADITLFKEKKDSLKVYGYTKIKDGVYFSDNKKFELGSGEILFVGKLLNPYLNLKAYYKKEPYFITILIGGRFDYPILNFTSSPYLTQNDILSILLFNTKASTLTNGQNQNKNPALSLFGSSFAKGLTDTLGVKLDRIELSTTKEGTIGVEVEKKIGRKTTIIYQNDLVQTIKIRYQNSKDIETDLTFSPEASGIDIVYKNEK